MEKIRLNRGLEAITDREWRMLKALKGRGNTPLHPRYITPTNAVILRAAGRVLPETVLPGVVRQFAGVEGELVFNKAVEDYTAKVSHD